MCDSRLIKSWTQSAWGNLFKQAVLTYVHTLDGERIVGYQVLDYRSNCLVYPSNNDIHDHAMGLDKAVALLKDLCAERGVTF